MNLHSKYQHFLTVSVDGVKYDLSYCTGLICGNCVLQWRYIGGNNWGDCKNGTGAVGCGPQEEFRGCSDITIGMRKCKCIQLC